MQDGHPPLGWNDTAAYLVLPVLLVVSQYVSMEIMKPPQVDKWISSLAFSVCHQYSSKWFFNPELFWFDRQMIQLKRTHFLFSSFYLLWLVTSLCLFHRDYLYTGLFLINNVTQLNLSMFCIHVFSFINWLRGSKKSVNFVPSIKTWHHIVIVEYHQHELHICCFYVMYFCSCCHICTFPHMEKIMSTIHCWS